MIDCSVSRWMEGQHKFSPLFEQLGNNVHLITTPFRTFATEKIEQTPNAIARIYGQSSWSRIVI